MRPARVLAAGFVAAVVVLTVIAVTGGFTVRVGPLQLTAHNWRGPAAVAALSLLGTVLLGRAAGAAAFASVWSFIDAHAAAIATVLAAAAGGIGVGFGTYAASSSDASGYVSEAALLEHGTLVSHEALALDVTLPTGGWAFSPLGYRPGRAAGELVPTYPAGLPLLLAPTRRIGGELAAYLVVPALGTLAVWCAYALGVRVHSRVAGVAAAALLATSPILLFQIVQPMSDVAATAWWALALVFALLPVPAAPMAAGAATGIALLIRPNLLALTALPAVAVAWPPTRGQSARRLVALAAGMTPALGALLLVQWRLYESPLVSGYGPGADLFALANIGPNLLGYAARVVQGEAPALVLAVVAAACVLVWRGRDEKPAAARLWPPLVLGTIAAALTGASYLPYAVFTEWSYLRFLLPAFPIVFVAIGALVTEAGLRLPAAYRGVVFLTALTAACAVNIERAEREQAFNLRRYESRYRLAGRYLDQALPSNAVIVSVQQSGSVRYYTGRPILRWDALGTDLESALTAMRSADRHPFLLVEDWERRNLATKFPASDHARLDWRPRAEFGDDTRVHLFDPDDRGSNASWSVDRVH